MADGVDLAAPTGTVASDEVVDGTLGTVQVQYVKIMDGTLNGTTKAVVGAAGIKVDGSGATQPVSGTFWQATQPVSAAALPLPSGAATAAKQPALGTAGTASTDVITVQGIASGTAQPVSVASLPLPSSAATSTKQSDGTQKTQIVDGSGNVIASTSNALKVVDTALAAVFPSTLGTAAAAASLGVALSTEDNARLGLTTSSGAPTTATTTGGINDTLRGLFQWNIGSTGATFTVSTPVSVTITTPTLLIASSTTRRFGAVKNMNASLTLYIGGSGVTSGTGWPLLPGEGLDLAQFTGAVYGITATGTVSAAVIAW